jgi:hypothetical protein
MKILFLFVPFVIALSALAQPQNDATPVMSEFIGEARDFNPRESHWFSTYAFEGMGYNKLPFSFNGQKKDFKETTRTLYGGRIGFGGELYLGAGFMTATKVEGYYMGSLFAKAQTADPAYNVEVAYTKETGQVLGADAVQTLSFLFNMKTKNPFMGEMVRLTVEPFVLAGIGVAQGINKIDYKYDTTIDERYLLTVVDNIANSKIGAGINLISSQGFFLNLQVTMNSFDILERKLKGYYSPDGTTITSLNADVKNAKMDAVTIYTIGGGYKF